ncbi:RICIN domain-containing protein [Saccharopolyspora shandongensis]|uniref:RICIN domain-containing protein n=1 Tax=Saccharopolyspora shandongensis TaxID=418495 RepID=UPI003418CDFF
MSKDWPDPRDARNATEFVAAMRQLRTRTELSFRSLERRAEQNGDVLPSSTTSAALARDKLPRAELVAAYVRACGGDAGTVESWVSARAAIAVGASSDPDPDPDPGPEPEPELSGPDDVADDVARSTPRRHIAILAGVALVVGGLATTGTMLIAGKDDEQQPPVAAPQPVAVSDLTGPLRLAHTGLCVGEGPEKFVSQERIVLGQHDCASAFPPITLEPVADGYRLLLQHPTKGTGCVTVDYGGTNTDVLLTGAQCEDDRADQRFTFEQVSAPAAGYRMHSVAGAQWCIGVFQRSTDPGAQLVQQLCDGGPHQVFTLNRP